MQTQLFWMPYSKIYKRSKFQQKKISYEGDMIFQRWQLNSVSKQVAWRNKSKFHPEASKPKYKCFQQFSSSSKYSRRSRKAATNLKTAATNLKTAASSQPPAASRLHTTTIYWCSHLNFDFLTYNLCINRGRVEGGGRARREETQTLLSTNQKLCILSSLGVVVQ